MKPPISARTVSFSAFGSVLVEHTWMPALSWLTVDDLVQQHLPELAAREPGVSAGSVTGDRELTEREFEWPDGRRALTRYLAWDGRFVRVTATGTTDREDLTAAIEDRLDHDRRIALSALEVRVVEELLGLEPVPFLSAPWWRDIEPGQRRLLAEHLAARLADEGFLINDGFSERLLRTVRPILDADLVAVATRRDPADACTVVAGVREGQWSLAWGRTEAQVTFLPVADETVVARLLARLGFPRDTAPGEPMTLWQIAMVRKAPGGLETNELAWGADDRGTWRFEVGATEAVASSADDITQALADALSLSSKGALR